VLLFWWYFQLEWCRRRGERKKCSSRNSYDRVYAGLEILLDLERCGDATALHHIHRSYTTTCFIIFFFTLLILLHAQRVLGKFQTPVNKSGNWTRSVLWKGHFYNVLLQKFSRKSSKSGKIVRLKECEWPEDLMTFRLRFSNKLSYASNHIWLLAKFLVNFPNHILYFLYNTYSSILHNKHAIAVQTSINE